MYISADLTLLHSERPKLHRVLAVLSAIWLNMDFGSSECNRVKYGVLVVLSMVKYGVLAVLIAFVRSECYRVKYGVLAVLSATGLNMEF